VTVWEQERALARTGAGAAIAIQRAFLLLHDAHYAWRTRPRVRAGYRDGPGG
jgi:hypothetical protein